MNKKAHKREKVWELPLQGPATASFCTFSKGYYGTEEDINEYLRTLKEDPQTQEVYLELCKDCSKMVGHRLIGQKELVLENKEVFSDLMCYSNYWKKWRIVQDRFWGMPKILYIEKTAVTRQSYGAIIAELLLQNDFPKCRTKNLTILHVVVYDERTNRQERIKIFMKNVKKICSLILVLTLLASMVPAALAASHPFKDVKSGSWYEEPVAYCYKNDLMNGTSNTTFEPELAMSRAMLVTVLYRAAGEPAAKGKHPFTDVKSGTYYTNAVIWAYQNSVVNGTSKTKFSPNNNISREEMVTIFYRYAKAKGYVINNYTKLNNYKDSGKISAYAKEAFQWAVADGIIQGTSATQLSPGGQATRAQCAAIIQRFVNWTESNSGTKDPTDPTVHTHSYTSSVTQKATCLSSGTRTYSCSCGDSYTEKIPTLEHNWVHYHEGGEIGNWEDGSGHWGDRTLVCTCGWSVSQSTAAKENLLAGDFWIEHHALPYTIISAINDHSYTYVTFAEDWVEDIPIVDRWTCSNCGTSTTNHDEVTGHKMRIRREATGAYCLRGNYDEYACDTCSYAYKTNYIESHGHIWSKWKIIEEPTKTSRGWAERTCTEENCGYSMGDYADLVINGQHYHSYKPETGTVCIICGKDSVP